MHSTCETEFQRSLSAFKRPENVPVGVAPKLEKKITETQVIQFKRDVMSFLSTACAHIAEKSPVNMVLNARCLPSTLVESPDQSETRFACMVEVLFMKNQITSSCAEDSKKEFSEFIKVVVKENSGEFLQYDKPSHDSTDLMNFT